MHILAILGTRNPEGQTARATDAFLNTASARGATVERIFLPACRLEHCRQCNPNGWGICRSEGRCVIEDDFAKISEKLCQADAAVFATPVYFGELSESLRAYLDRLRRVAWAWREKGANRLAGKRVIGIAVAGGGGGGAPECIHSMEKILQTNGLDIVDLVPVRVQNLEAKCKVLKTTAEWIVAQ